MKRRKHLRWVWMGWILVGVALLGVRRMRTYPRLSASHLRQAVEIRTPDRTLGQAGKPRLVSFTPDHSSEPRPVTLKHDAHTVLLTRWATKVADDELESPYCWLSNHTLLFVEGPAGSAHLVLFDTTTRNQQELTDLQTQFNGSHGFTDWMQPSSDGLWLIWPGQSEVLVGSLNGKRLQHIRNEGDDVQLHNDTAHWLKDGSHFVLFGFYDVNRLVAADLYSCEDPNLHQSLRCTSFESISLLRATVTDRDRLVCVSALQPPYAAHQLQIIDTGLYDADPNQINYQTCVLPPCLVVEEVQIAPFGDRVAWLLLERKARSLVGPVQQVYAIWLSDGEGRGMQELGYVPAQSKQGNPLELFRLRWLPDEQHLSFIYQQALYTMPAAGFAP